MKKQRVEELKCVIAAIKDSNSKLALQLFTAFEEKYKLGAWALYIKGLTYYHNRLFNHANSALSSSYSLKKDKRTLKLLIRSTREQGYFRKVEELLNRFLYDYGVDEFVEAIAQKPGYSHLLKSISRDDSSSGEAQGDLSDILHMGILQNGKTLPRSGKKYLFVSGAPRSGTTALGDLVNLHPDVCVLREHYPYVPLHPKMFSYDVLERRYEEKYHMHMEYNEDLLEKRYKTAIYIGDKRPLFNRNWAMTQKNFHPEEMKVVHITRKPMDVIRSYMQRYDDECDAWTIPGIEAAFDWNQNTEFLVNNRNNPRWRESFISIIYEDVFRSRERIIDIWKELGLDIDKVPVNDLDIFLRNSSEHLGARNKYSEQCIEIYDKYVNKKGESQFYDNL